MKEVKEKRSSLHSFQNTYTQAIKLTMFNRKMTSPIRTTATPTPLTGDKISVSVARTLAKCSGPDGPIHFLLDFDQCNSPEALQYVGEVLKTNSTITWLEVKFRYHQVPPECMTNLFQFVSHHPHLKVLELRIGSSAVRTTTSIMGSIDEVIRLFLLSAAQNGNIETVKLRGRVCQYVTEIFKFIDRTNNIRHLELVNFPDSLVEAWPPNTSISTLVLKPAKSERYRNPLNPDCHLGLTGILDLLSESSSRGYSIKNLKIRQWSWSLPKYLQSPNSSVRSLHLSEVDFRHDRFSGFSPFSVFVFGIQGSKSTTELCLESCQMDAKCIEKFLKELKEGTLGLKVLKLKNMDSMDGEHIRELLKGETLKRLEMEGNVNVIDSCLYAINDGLSNSSSLPALRIPITSIADIAPSLKIACISHKLLHLEIVDTVLEEPDVICLADLLEDPRCQLLHFGLEFLSGFDIKIIMALEGHSKVEELVLKDAGGKSLLDLVDGLADCLANIVALKRLTVICADLTRKHEHELGEAIDKNWNLESVVFQRMVPDDEEAENPIHQAEPIISRAFQSKIDEVMRRNIEKKRSMSSSPSPNSVTALFENPALK